MTIFNSLKTIHIIDDELQCPIASCGVTVSNVLFLAVHAKRVHRTEFCPHCNMFTNPHWLKKKGHTSNSSCGHKCDFCGIFLHSREEKNNHVKENHLEKPKHKVWENIGLNKPNLQRLPNFQKWKPGTKINILIA
jgi:hypothetical protein